MSTLLVIGTIAAVPASAGGRADSASTVAASSTGSTGEASGVGNDPGTTADPPADRTPEVNYWAHLARKRLKLLGKRERRIVQLLKQLSRTEKHARSSKTFSARSSGDACLDELIQRESHWNVHATNPTTGAYGLPQALPGSKMASAGADWHDNARTQIRWMWGYVRGRYGGSCSALAFQKANGWY